MTTKIQINAALPLYLVWSEKNKGFVIVAAQSIKQARKAVR